MKNLFLLSIAFLVLLGLNASAQVKTEAVKNTTTQKVAEKPEVGDKIIAGKKGPNGQAVYEGAKGGIYYINKYGNKTYLKEQDKLIKDKKGPNGEKVYKGPQGGEYYLNKNGNRIYLKNNKK